MALIQCEECGKEISDKASACPGCGCPLSEMRSKDDLSKYTKDELWFKAYNIHHKGSKGDVYIAADIYNYIINIFPDSEQAKYASTQLKNLNDKFKPNNTNCTFNKSVNKSHTLTQCQTSKTPVDESIVLRIDGVRSWEKETPGINVGTCLGTFLLTNRRILFLSSGDSGIFSMGKLLASGVGGVAGGALGAIAVSSLVNVVGNSGKTKCLDLQDHANNGGYQVDLNKVISCDVNRRFDLSVYCTLKYYDTDNNKKFKCFKADGGISKEKWEAARSHIISTS